MTLTRSQTGKTPKKIQREGYVETPGRRVTRSRASMTPDLSADTENSDVPTSASSSQFLDSPMTSNSSARRHASGKNQNIVDDGIANGEKAVNGGGNPNGVAAVKNYKIDESGHFEFGGSLGCLSMMIGFPLLMYYMWIGATYYDGRLPLPEKGQTAKEFGLHLVNLAYEGAFPTAKAWITYWTFFVFEGLCYLFLPGVYVNGRKLEHLGGKQLPYYCSAYASFYTTIIAAVGLHVSGLYKLYTIIDEFGPLMSVAILTGFIVSIIAYVSARVRGAEHRMSGYPIYDFFMGAELNPRLFGILDFKMFFEVRLPWYILFLVTLGTAARQWENYGYVSGEVGFLLMAHYLYANACSKGEECIIATWDMYYEKWGFMLIFWNLAGVPLSYCHCTIYLANHHPDTYRLNRYALVSLYIAYLFVYWVWDTTNSQKNRFRQQREGGMTQRKTFPQLPWQTVKNPRTITSKDGHTILVDGWYGYARKIHYTCDLFFALSWGFVTGFDSPFPWFYPVFFAAMISHRALRDIQRCRKKYGEAWTQYEKEVPYLFIPYVI
ncbi:hypothetical protein ACJ72_04913 [Emergomyces africanus]|uniref:Delta(24(24(1)))-sterol reductase n=1 Tax=Emergomyces africanus TaxID=1955775 RepID=A0A1B7NVT9_9EURO|nr:hypothetical protein ACJ72_04913 [Emergomyces africanus]